MRPIGPGAPMRSDGAPRSTFAAGASERSGRWPSRVWTIEQAEPSRGVEDGAAGRDRRMQAGHVVAEGLAETAVLEEVALHVDDDQRGAAEIDGDRFGFSLDEGRHGETSAIGGASRVPRRDIAWEVAGQSPAGPDRRVRSSRYEQRRGDPAAVGGHARQTVGAAGCIQ